MTRLCVGTLLVSIGFFGCVRHPPQAEHLGETILGYGTVRTNQSVRSKTASWSSSHELISSKLIISLANPSSPSFALQLVSIGPNHSAVVKCLKTGEIVSAVEGGYFVCKQFGAEGLRLVSVSSERNSVVLEVTDCVDSP